MGKKAMKAMKAKKKVSKIARGKRAKSSVLRGTKVKTASGLTAKDLMKNKRGKVVSKKAHAAGQKRGWMKAVAVARKALKIKGFCAVGGKSAAGKALYAKAKACYKK